MSGRDIDLAHYQIKRSVYQADPNDPNTWKYKVEKSGKKSIKDLN